MDIPPKEPEPLRFDRGTLLLTYPPPARLAHLWLRDERTAAWRCDAMHFSQVVQALKDDAPAYRLNVAGQAAVTWPRPNLAVLRPDQEAALMAWMNTRRGVLVMPTGT